MRDKELAETFELIIKIASKLTRDEHNAIWGILKSYREEAEYYRNKCGTQK